MPTFWAATPGNTGLEGICNVIGIVHAATQAATCQSKQVHCITCKDPHHWQPACADALRSACGRSHSWPLKQHSWAQPQLTAHARHTATTNSQVLDNAITKHCLPDLNTQHYTTMRGPLQEECQPHPQQSLTTASDSRDPEGQWW